MTRVVRTPSAAIPFALPHLPTWREWTKTEGVDYRTLTYEVRWPRAHPPSY